MNNQNNNNDDNYKLKIEDIIILIIAYVGLNLMCMEYILGIDVAQEIVNFIIKK